MLVLFQNSENGADFFQNITIPSRPTTRIEAPIFQTRQNGESVYTFHETPDYPLLMSMLCH